MLCSNDINRRPRYHCAVCNNLFPNRKDVENHVVTEHGSEMLDCHDDEISDDGDDAADSDLDSTHDRSRNQKRYSRRGPLIKPCPNVFKTEWEFRYQCYAENILPSLCASLADWSAEVDGSSYLPSTKCSAKFSVEYSSSNQSDLRTIETLGGCVDNSSSPMLFAGGPITAMAWCNFMQPNMSQILAVSTNSDFTPSIQSNRSGGSGLIQIWGIGPLTDMEDVTPPTLLFGIAHNYGEIRGLEFCPSGGQTVDRLGILAAGCGDGSVRIWALPTPEKIRERRFLLKEADLTLESGDEAGQCLCVSWYRGPGHDYIAASFSSGIVCVWHLSTNSPLLRKDNILAPWMSWLAHTASCISIEFSPSMHQQPTQIITGGTDRSARLWDLKNPTVPLQGVRIGLLSSVRWLGDGNKMVTYDDVYLQGHTQTVVTGQGGVQPVLAQSSPVLDMSVSHWLPVVGMGTAAGELLSVGTEQGKAVVSRTLLMTEGEVQGEIRKYENVKNCSTIKFVDSLDMLEFTAGDSLVTKDISCYPMNSISQVKWNNNPSSHLWLASGYYSGIVRLHCMKSLDSGAVTEADD